MHLSIVSSGYVGTILAACFADFGYDVVTIDIDESVVETGRTHSIRAATPVENTMASKSRTRAMTT